MQSCCITVPELFVDVNEQMPLPVVLIHDFADVAGPHTALLRQGLPPGFLEHYAEGTSLRRQAGEERRHLKHSVRVFRHDIGKITEAEHHLGLRAEIFKAPVVPLAEQGTHVIDRELAEVVHDITQIYLKDHAVQAS